MPLCFHAATQQQQGSGVTSQYAILIDDVDTPPSSSHQLHANFQTPVPRVTDPATASSSHQQQLPADYQATVPRFKTPAPATASSHQQQQLPPQYQAAFRRPVSINRGPITSTTSSASTMTLTLKRGIPRRTCFAMEFTPAPQHEAYLTVTSFVEDNSDFMRTSLLDNAPRLFKVHMSIEAQFSHATNLDQVKK